MGGSLEAAVSPAADHRFMGLACALGRRGLGRTWPNPSVGCVIVQGARIIGRGRTADGGRPHAEGVALAEAGLAARGATAYVTLEPCAHHGQTGPCAEALVAAGIARVVVAIGDPDARVAGRGIAMLRAAGVDVTEGVRRVEAAYDQQGYLKRVTTERPFVTLKLATSLDGRIATATGESRWITGAAARARVHAMRASHDAVMIGGGTARADDPSLDVRGWGVQAPRPVRVVLSAGLDLPLDSRLGHTARAQPVWLCHAVAAPMAAIAVWNDLGAHCICCEAGDGAHGVSIQSALSALGGRGISRVFCEGGGGLAASLIAADAVDELVTFTAGFSIGGDGTAAIAALGLAALTEAERFDLVDVSPVGADVMARWRKRPQAGALA